MSKNVHFQYNRIPFSTQLIFCPTEYPLQNYLYDMIKIWYTDKVLRNDAWEYPYDFLLCDRQPQQGIGDSMRLRNIPGADEVIQNSPYCIHEPQQYAGNWSSLYDNEQPLHIEIGMGKGQFIMGMAQAHPHINYLGIEKYTSVLLRAVQKMEADPLPNLRFLCFNAEQITEIFAPGEVDRIYLNFSDPWPKDRHAKRRLTSSAFLERYHQILEPEGQIEFKTDNRELFDFSLAEIAASPVWKMDACTYDLHNDTTMNAGNIMTEYEEKFSSIGNPICKLICSRPS